MSNWISQTLESTGYFGVGLLMALENFFPPIPSEVVMPLAGYSARQGEMSFVGVMLAGTVGAVIGATAWYLLGLWVSEPRFLNWLGRHGSWIGVKRKEAERGLDWFERWGSWAVGVGRLIPAVRTLISIPAGLAGMNFIKFLLVTTAGTLIWNLLLGGLGWYLRDSYGQIESVVGWISTAVIALAILWWLQRVIRYHGKFEGDESDAPRQEAKGEVQKAK